MVVSNLEIIPNVYYTVEEAGAMLRVSPAAVRRLLRTGVARGIRIGRAWRVLGSDLLQLPREDEWSDEELRRSAMLLSEPTLARIWDNEVDAIYDTL